MAGTLPKPGNLSADGRALLSWLIEINLITRLVPPANLHCANFPLRASDKMCFSCVQVRLSMCALAGSVNLHELSMGVQRKKSTEIRVGKEKTVRHQKMGVCVCVCSVKHSSSVVLCWCVRSYRCVINVSLFIACLGSLSLSLSLSFSVSLLNIVQQAIRGPLCCGFAIKRTRWLLERAFPYMREVANRGAQGKTERERAINSFAR